MIQRVVGRIFGDKNIPILLFPDIHVPNLNPPHTKIAAYTLLTGWTRADYDFVISRSRPQTKGGEFADLIREVEICYELKFVDAEELQSEKGVNDDQPVLP